MRTVRVPVAGTVILVLLGGLSGVVVAQDGEAMPSDGPHPVSGQILVGRFVQMPEVTWDGDRGVEMSRGGRVVDAVEMGDPRLTGALSRVWNRDSIGGPLKLGLGEVETGIVELASDDGSWVGTMRGYASMSPRTHYWHIELTGTGAHEGLSALLYANGPQGGPWDVEGFIFPGVLPEYPDPVEAPAD